MLLIAVSIVNLALAIVLLGLIAFARVGREVVLPLLVAVAGLCGVIAMLHPVNAHSNVPPDDVDPGAAKLILQTMQQNFLTLRSDIKSVQSTVTDVQTNVNTLTTDIADMRNEIKDEIKTEINNVQTNVNNVTTNIANMRSEIKTEIKTEIKNVRTDVKNVQINIVDIRKSVVGVQGTLVQLSDKISRCGSCHRVVNIHKRIHWGHPARPCACRLAVPDATRAELGPRGYLAY
jgi:methyl-accepting chemotaxis protein